MKNKKNTGLIALPNEIWGEIISFLPKTSKDTNYLFLTPDNQQGIFDQEKFDAFCSEILALRSTSKDIKNGIDAHFKLKKNIAHKFFWSPNKNKTPSTNTAVTTLINIFSQVTFKNILWTKESELKKIVTNCLESLHQDPTLLDKVRSYIHRRNTLKVWTIMFGISLPIIIGSSIASIFIAKQLYKNDTVTALTPFVIWFTYLAFCLGPVIAYRIYNFFICENEETIEQQNTELNKNDQQKVNIPSKASKLNETLEFMAWFLQDKDAQMLFKKYIAEPLKNTSKEKTEDFLAFILSDPDRKKLHVCLSQLAGTFIPEVIIEKNTSDETTTLLPSRPR